LVFITRVYHDAPSSECQMQRLLKFANLNERGNIFTQGHAFQEVPSYWFCYVDGFRCIRLCAQPMRILSCTLWNHELWKVTSVLFI